MPILLILCLELIIKVFDLQSWRVLRQEIVVARWGSELGILPDISVTSNRGKISKGDVIWWEHSLELILGVHAEVEVIAEDGLIIKYGEGTVEDEVLSVVKEVDIVMDVEGVDSFTATAIPELSHGSDAVVSMCDSVDIVVLGLVVQTAVEGCRI